MKDLNSVVNGFVGLENIKLVSGVVNGYKKEV